MRPTVALALIVPVSISSRKCNSNVFLSIGLPVSGLMVTRQISSCEIPKPVIASTLPRWSAEGANFLLIGRPAPSRAPPLPGPGMLGGAGFFGRPAPGRAPPLAIQSPLRCFKKFHWTSAPRGASMRLSLIGERDNAINEREDHRPLRP